MPGIRTAGTFTGTPTHRLITLHLIDVSGDYFTDAFYVPPATTAADIETYVAAYQAATQASVWNISDQGQYLGDDDPDNALADQRSSVKDGVNLLMKNAATLDSVTPRLVAPMPTVMQGNQDIPLLSATPMTNLILAWLAIKPGFNLKSAQFTERTERSNNPRVK